MRYIYSIYHKKYTFKVFPFLFFPPNIKVAGLVCFYFLENFIPVRMEELIILLHYEHQDETLDYIKAFLFLQSILGRISFMSVISKVKRSSKPDSSMIQNLFIKPVT